MYVNKTALYRHRRRLVYCVGIGGVGTQNVCLSESFPTVRSTYRTHVDTHGYTHVYTHVYTLVYTHVYTLVYTHVYTLVYTHVYTHGYTLRR